LNGLGRALTRPRWAGTRHGGIPRLPRDSCPQRIWDWLALVVLLALIFGARLMVLNRHPYPPSEDLGGDLVVLDAMLSRDPVRPDYRFHSPPLYHLLVVWTFNRVLSVFDAAKVYTALVPTLMGVPFFLLVGSFVGGRRAALVATGLFTFSEAFNEMIAWGGVLNTLGMIFMIFFSLFLLRILKGGGMRDGLLAGVFASLTAGTHHLTAVYLGFVFLLALLIMIVLARKDVKGRLIPLSLVVLVGGLASLPYADVYLWGMRNTVNVGASAQDVLLFSSRLPQVIGNLARGMPTFAVFVALGLVSLVYFFSTCRERCVLAVELSLILAVFALLLMLKPDTMIRASYFAPLPIFLAIGFFFSAALRWAARGRLGCLGGVERSLASVMAALLVALPVGLLSYGSYRRLATAVDYYQILNDDVVEALDWLAENTESDAVVYTNYNGLKSWIEGYGRRLCLDSRPLDYLVTRAEWLETADANRLALGNYGLESERLAVADHFPSGYDNPGIHLKIPGYSVPVIYLYDELQTAQFSKVGHEEEFVTNLLSAQAKHAQECAPNEHGLSRRFEYGWDFGAASRVVGVEDTAVNVLYEVHFLDSKVRLFNLTASFYPGVEVSDVRFDGQSSFASGSSGGWRFWMELVPVHDEGVPLEIGYDYHRRALAFCFKPASSSFRVGVRLTLGIDPEVAGFTEPASLCWDMYKLVDALGISHIVLDKNRYAEFIRFTNNYPDFSHRVFENDRMLVLEISRKAGG